MEKYGYENIKKIMVAAMAAVMAVDKLANKDGILSLFGLIKDFEALGSVKMDQLKQELSDLSVEERSSLSLALKEKLVLHNPVIEAKIESGMDLIAEASAVVESAVSIVNRAKALFS